MRGSEYPAPQSWCIASLGPFALPPTLVEQQTGNKARFYLIKRTQRVRECRVPAWALLECTFPGHITITEGQGGWNTLKPFL